MGSKKYTCTQSRSGKSHHRQVTADEHRSDKREEAEERNAVWRKLTPEQQLAELDKRGCSARKQRVRIQAVIDKQVSVHESKKAETKKNKPRGQGGHLKHRHQ